MSAFGIITSVGLFFSLLSYSSYLIDHGKKVNLPSQPLDCGISRHENNIPANPKNHSLIMKYLNRTAKIIRGQETMPNSYPWLVSIRVKRLINFHICGGSLIYDDLVITAAHCVASFKPEHLTIVVNKFLS